MMGEISNSNWYATMKARARSEFATGHWPLVTEEEWRRSDVSKLGLDVFIGAAGPGSAGFTASLSPGALSAGLRLSPARDLSALGSESSSAAALRAHIESSLDQGDRFAAWNLAEGEAWVLELPADFIATEPIVVDCAISGRAAHPRLMVAAGPGSQADIVYRLAANTGAGAVVATNAGAAKGVATIAGAGGIVAGTPPPKLSGPCLVNSAVGLWLGEGAIVKFFESRESDDEALWFVEEKASLSRDARLLHFTVDSSGRFVKSRVECALEGSGADADLDGIFYGSSGRQLDLRTVQRHVAPRATSRALYKGALDWGGRSVFQGLIEVAKEASGTDAFLANRNLVLGAGARADSIPTLRIGNNDVRCSHGSTTGKLSEAEVFYLESRGFDREAARELLVLGFFNELLDLAPDVFSEPVARRLAERLGSASRLERAKARAGKAA